MTTFALITEGITDQAIIENILDCLTKGEATTNPLRPLRDETDKSRVAENEYSNWELVLEYLSSEDILDAIQTNDFLVVQVDTDCCNHPNFGVPLDDHGTPKSIEQIIYDCITTLKDRLNPNFPVTELNRLIFAIPVLSSECWLVALLDQDHTHTRKTINACGQRLLPLLARKRIRLQKEYAAYSELSKQFRKTKTLAKAVEKTPCLRAFVDQVKQIFETQPCGQA